MRLFTQIYQRTLILSKHRLAIYYLAAFSFIESSVFTTPPALMLVPMGLAKPDKLWRYVTVAIISSCLGACFGYGIGWFFAPWVLSGLDYFGYASTYQQVQMTLHTHGSGILVIAALSPVPFKFFALGAGLLQMPLLPFITATLLGRALRFCALGIILHWGGKE